MQKRWIGIFSLLLVVFLFFFVKAGKQVGEYLSLNTQTRALVENWQIIRKAEDSFAIEVSYQFYVKDREFVGKTEFIKPYFPNEESARKAIQKLSLQPWAVFFHKENPEKSSLQRKFPFQGCIHAFLVLGLLVYFVFLKKWLEKSSFV